MKRLSLASIIFLPVLWFACNSSNTQQVGSTNLLYSDAAIQLVSEKIRLKNNSFKSDEAGTHFISLPQGVAVYLSVEGDNAARIKALIQKNKRLETIKAELKPGEKVEEIFFIKVREKDKEVAFYPMNLNREGLSEVVVKGAKNYEANMEGRWIFSYYPASEYSTASIDAMYILKEFKTKSLSPAADNCIRYTDHLIDTNSIIFNTSASDYSKFAAFKKNPLIDSLLKLTSNYPGEPSFPSDTSMKAYEEYEVKHTKWEESRQNYIKQNLSKTEKFKTLLKAAYQSVATSHKVYDADMNEFEMYVEKYISPSAALELKRKRTVMGNCSMDKGPIVHAVNIARLAGETCCMDIFLRAHLDILYDRFDRLTDGSYAEPGRETYAKELEVIGVKLALLIPGTLFAADNFPKNHYRGELNRAGRAMFELQSRKYVYGEIEKLIQDRELDYYNRLVLIFLAESYNHHLVMGKQSQESARNLKRLQATINTFPDYIKVPLTERIKSIKNTP